MKYDGHTHISHFSHYYVFLLGIYEYLQHTILVQFHSSIYNHIIHHINISFQHIQCDKPCRDFCQSYYSVSSVLITKSESDDIVINMGKLIVATSKNVQSYNP